MPLIRAARASIDRRRDSTVSLPPTIGASPAEVRQPTRAHTLPGRPPRRQVGTLVVVVLKAKNLPDKHVVSKQNPYTKITYDGQTLVTAVDKRGGQHPVWDEELRFTVHVDPPTLAEDGSVITPGLPTSMDISLWANEGDHADLLGGTVIDVADTLRRGEFDEWIPLYRNDTQRGDVFLEMTYFSALPPSLGRLSLQCDRTSPAAPVELSPPGQILQEPKAVENEALPPPPPVKATAHPVPPPTAPIEPMLPGGLPEDATPALAPNSPAPAPPADTAKEPERAKPHKLRKLTKARPSQSSISSQSDAETPPPATPTASVSLDVVAVEGADMPGGFEIVVEPEAPAVEEPKKEAHGGLLSSLLDTVSGILHSHETKA